MAIKTFTAGSILTASDTNAYLANAGLVYVDSRDLAGTITSIDGCFTSTYRNYKVFITIQSGTDTATVLKLRTSAGDQSSSYYCGAWLVDGSGTSNQSQNNATEFRFGYYYTSSGTAITEMTIANPQVAGITTGFTGTNGHYYTTSGTARTMSFGGTHYVSQSNTGFSILASSSLTGNVRIYGIREP